MLFRDIPQFVHDGGYTCDIPFESLPDEVKRFITKYGLQMQPDFQRAHVWSNKQSIKFVEFLLRGGSSSRIIYFNHPGWMSCYEGDFVLVDGLQRLTACMQFVNYWRAWVPAVLVSRVGARRPFLLPAGRIIANFSVLTICLGGSFWIPLQTSISICITPTWATFFTFCHSTVVVLLNFCANQRNTNQ